MPATAPASTSWCASLARRAASVPPWLSCQAGSWMVGGERLHVLRDASWREAGAAPSTALPGEQAFEAMSRAAGVDSGSQHSRTL
eukprot:15387252-Alexandrium_andersonii.AAC.1